MTGTASNLVLIGMPGAGKSTVGVILAKATARSFVDTDVLIQTEHRRSLQDIVDKDGYPAFRIIEEEILCGLSVTNSVIATGGSAIYSDRAMAHLKSRGVVIFIDVDLPTLETRVHNLRTRGLAKRPDQNFADLFHERSALYTKYADITIRYTGQSHEELCTQIIEQL